MTHRFSVIVVFLCLAVCARADEQTVRLRVIGLCSPDRQDDLRQIVGKIAGLQLVTLDYEKTEADFRCDVPRMLANFNPKKPPTPGQIVARLDEMLRAASQGTFSVTPPSAVPRDKLTVVEIKIGILDCKACRFAAYQAVAKKEGVERATVDSEKGIITAWIDPAKTDRPALEDALKKARVDLPP